MDFIELYFGTDINTILFVVINLVIIESLLSVDNAAALALMVKDLPENQRGKALKYGIFGAYFFRGLCLIFFSLLIQITWVKVLGGLYLIWIAVNHFMSKGKGGEDEDPENFGIFRKIKNFLYQKTIGWVGAFWSTVILVEIMDLSFSVDNIFAAVAFTDKAGLICLGVFIGILAMRFVAQKFVVLMEKFPKLETAAFIVLIILGVKLVLSYIADFDKEGLLFKVINSHGTDMAFSIVTLFVFFFPVIWNLKWDKIFARSAKGKELEDRR